MVVRRRGGVEQGEPGIAVALAEVAQHLVEGAVLLDHVDHVLDPVEVGGLARRPHVRVVVAADIGRVAGQLSLGGHRDHVERALHHRLHGFGVLVDVRINRVGALGQRAPRPARVGATDRAVEVGDHQIAAVGRHVHVGGVPGGGDEAARAARARIDHLHRVLAAERHVQRGAVRTYREAVRRGAHGMALGESDGKGGRELVAPGVDHRHRVAVRVGHVHLVARGVGGDRVRVIGLERPVEGGEQDVVELLLAGGVDHGHGAAEPVGHVRLAPVALERDGERLAVDAEVDQAGDGIGSRVDHRHLVAGRVALAAGSGEVVGHV